MVRVLFGAVAAAGLVLATGCAALSDKAVAMGSQVNGFRLQTAGSVNTGTVLPNISLGTGECTICTAPVLQKDSTTQVVLAYSESTSFFGALFGINAGSKTFTYIGAPNEDASQTRERLSAVVDVLTEEK